MNELPLDTNFYTMLDGKAYYIVPTRRPPDQYYPYNINVNSFNTYTYLYNGQTISVPPNNSSFLTSWNNLAAVLCVTCSTHIIGVPSMSSWGVWFCSRECSAEYLFGVLRENETL